MAEEVKQEQQADAAAQPAKDKKPAKVEIPLNCGSCNKPLKRIRYYRNMKFFCNKKCWETLKEKLEKETQKASEQPAA